MHCNTFKNYIYYNVQTDQKVFGKKDKDSYINDLYEVSQIANTNTVSLFARMKK